MKKAYIFFIFALLWCNVSLADKIVGKGDLKFSDEMVDYFMKYLNTPAGQSPLSFFVAMNDDGAWYATYWYCPAGNCRTGSLKNYQKRCNTYAKKNYNIVDQCFLFAKRNYAVWENGINPAHYKKSSFKSKWSRREVIDKLTELGFYGSTSLTVSSTESNTTSKKTEKKKEKPKKIVKKYELEGDRSIALSWEGYEDLIAGTVKFDETDYRGTLKLPLPNNDGSCDGTYSLQKGGKGTWQIACTNEMGAAGTLKWIKDGGITGIGRDHNDKKVKFTVSKDS